MPATSTHKLINLFYHLSLRNKLTLLLTIVAILPVLVIASYSYNQASQAYENTARTLDFNHMIQAAHNMDQDLNQIPMDLSFLAQFHDLQRYLQWHDIGEQQEARRWRKSTENGFHSFMLANPLYMQLRVIDKHGQEVVRIDRNQSSNGVSTVPQTYLQNKHKHDYFTRTMQLKSKHYFVSAMNLNREHGEIQQPHIPVIRYALPLIDRNNTRHGIIILNVYGAKILNKTQQQTDSDDQTEGVLYTVNQDGFYLSHADNNKTFAFDLAHNSNLKLENPALWAAMQAGEDTLITADTVFAFKKIYPLQANPAQYWFVIHAVPVSESLAELISFQQVFLGIVIIMLLLLLLLTPPVTRSIANPIQRITVNMQRLERGETRLEHVSYHGKDELGELVDACHGMGQRITDAIQQANNIAQGDFRSEIKAYSDNDELAIALQSMIQTLQQVASIAEAVAQGNFSNSIDIKGKHDQLGQSINSMIDTMRNTTAHAQAIAHGDFSAEVSVQNKSDELGLALQRMNQTLRQLANVAAAIATGDYSVDVEVQGQKDQLGRSIVHMTQALRASSQETEQRNWLQTNLAEINQSIQGKSDIQDLANTVMSLLARMLNASHATFFIWQEDDNILQLKGHFACNDCSVKKHIKLGEGLTGQCGRDKVIMNIEDVPEDYLSIESSLGQTPPRQLIEVPLLADNALAGVMEFAFLRPLNDIQHKLLQQLSPILGITVHILQQNIHTKQLLEESQTLSEELQAQEEELRQANSTLHMRAEELTASEEELQAQQEELRLNNEELIEKNDTVEAQKDDLTASAKSLTMQAEQLRQASQYKSDFLSNMSHELRTPLNSLLILSDMLAKNKDGNLTDKQVEFANTIYGSGTDLLALINSILDLAKVEAGKMNLDPHRFPLHDISDAMQRDFAHMADKKGLTLRILHSAKLPEMMFNDAMRIKQVLKNLLSNALKFTSEGEVIFKLERVDTSQISFAVKDSGVGIAADKLHDIFEAFQQEDGSTSRKYGGTGLGLSICRELSKLLGGHITVQSEQGKGSTFALIIPIECGAEEFASDHTDHIIMATASAGDGNEDNIIEEDHDIPIQTIPNPMHDDRDEITGNDQSILIIEDDQAFASIQQDLVREHDFKAINALRGDHGMMLAQHYIPDAILLDLQLPVLDGISLLDRFKQHPKLRHIPVHVISCMDQQTEQRVLQAGAISFIHKPAKKEQIDAVLEDITTFIKRDIRQLLIVEDNDKQLHAMTALLTANDVRILTASTAAEALHVLRHEHVDCMILDLSLPDMSGEDVLQAIQAEGAAINQGHVLPVIVHTGKDLSEQEVEKLQGMSKSIIVKGNYSPDRLLAETSLFLHQIETDMPEEKQQRIEHVRELDVDLSGKAVLLVDDDIRNIYSLSSYLEGHGLNVYTARNGLQALTTLEEYADSIDLILMDIMMPEMDGYAAMQAIREIDRHQNLPIISLTAKAMKGDREQCIAAGASDYITKPVDTDKLLSLMRVWLHE